MLAARMVSDITITIGARPIAIKQDSKKQDQKI